MQSAKVDLLPWAGGSWKSESQVDKQAMRDCLYVRITCQVAEADRVLLKLVAPLAQCLWDEGLIQECFFIRYYEGGHHLRVRFFGQHKALFGAAKAVINEHMSAYFSEDRDQCCEPLDQGPEGSDDQSWQPLYAASASRPVPSYEYQRYEPEIERYGGLQALQVSEHHFTYSSAVALQVLAQERDGNGSRRNAALLLLHASAEGFQLDAEQRAASFAQFYLRRRMLAWHTPPSEDILEQEYTRNRANLRLLLPYDHHAPAHRGRTAWLPLIEQWRCRIGETYRLLQLLQEQGQLSVPLIVILSAYMHMLCNRLGIYPREETYLCYLLYRAYTERLALSQLSS